MKPYLKALLFALGLVLAAPALAEHTPETLAGAKLVGADEARKLIDGGVPAIDTRVANEYAEAHIKGAKNVPYKEKSAKNVGFDPKEDSFDLAKLPADKSAPLVMYCNAGECWKSYKAARVAIAAGYKNVYWLRGGIPEWKGKGFPIE
jgi:rhodanese-related sulfurtransferase